MQSDCCFSLNLKCSLLLYISFLTVDFFNVKDHIKKKIKAPYIIPWSPRGRVPNNLSVFSLNTKAEHLRAPKWHFQPHMQIQE